MNKIKQFFCKHEYSLIENDYLSLGWSKCRCGKTKYTGENVAFTHFKFPKIYLGDDED